MLDRRTRLARSLEVEGRMRFCTLRMTVSSVCVVACVLLIVLWVRSYWRSDSAIMSPHRITSFNGRIVFSSDGWYYGEDSRLYCELGRSPEAAPTQWFKNTGLVWQYPSAVAIPYLCPGLLLAAVAVAPWLRWSNRFTLHTLLIATTLVAVVLGLIVWVH